MESSRIVNGLNYPREKYQTFCKTKTRSGSIGFFVAVVLISLLLMVGVEKMTFVAALPVVIAVGAITTIAEAMTHGV